MLNQRGSQTRMTDLIGIGSELPPLGAGGLSDRNLCRFQ